VPSKGKGIRTLYADNTAIIRLPYLAAPDYNQAVKLNYALTLTQRDDARRALDLLDGTGMSLEDAARRAIHGRSAGEKITLSDAVERFKRTRAHLRPKTFEWYAMCLAPFQNPPLASKLCDAVSKADLRKLAESQDRSESTRAAYSRAIRACWAWMLKQDPPLAGMDPTEGLKTNPPRRVQEVEFLSVEQCAAVMADPYQRAAKALMLFAGIRPEEVAGRGKPPMLWGAVNLTEKHIRISGECSKTGRPRMIEGLPDAFWIWLGQPGAAEKPIATAQGQNITRTTRERLGQEWPHDALRHTFATYAMAWTANAPQVSVWLGHEGNPTMLHRHYRGLATKSQAEAFFNLRPN